MEHTGRAPIPFYMVMTALIAATGGLLFGYDTGIISGALLHIEQSFTVGTWTKELIVSAVVMGALLGALLSGRLVDRYGSQRMLRYMAVTFIFGTVLSCLAQSVSVLIAGRLLIGVAIGVTSYLSPLFISEMAPAHLRGALVLLNGVMITSGESFAFLTDYFLEPTQSWRLMFATGLIPAVILFFGTLLLPPSPRWLALKGRMAEAKQTLEKIRGSTAVSVELQEICSHLHHGHAELKDCLSPTVRPALIIGVTLGVLQQFVGINTVMYYGPTIFAAVGYATNSDQLFSTFILGVINTVVTLISILLVERVGRRRMLLTGLAMSGVALFLLGSLMSAAITYPLISLLLLVIYIAGYSMSIGSLFWLIISEIFPLNLRGTGMSAATAAQWAGNVVVTMTFLSLLNALGSQKVFWLYGAMCGLGAAFCYYFVPETQGVPLEQIERNLRTGKSTRQLGEPLTSSIKG